MKKFVLSLVLIQSLAGCASWFTPVGSDTFDCNRRDDPASPHCRSMRSVDDSTKGSIPPTRYDKKFSMSEVDELNGISQGKNLPNSKAQTQTTLNNAPNNAPNNSKATESVGGAGMPVRMGPVIQRVWIQKFKTDNDTLVQDTYVYKEVQGTRWSGFEDSGAASLEGKSAQLYPHKAIREETLSPISPAVQTPSGGSAFGENAASDSDEAWTTGAGGISPSKPN